MQRLRYRTKKSNFRNRFTKYLKGNATISVMVIVIIIGAIFLAGGVFPKSPGDPNYNSGLGAEGEIDENSIIQDPTQDSLQLQTLKFNPCTSTVAVVMELDTTGSMQGSKIQNLKTAVKSFTNNMTDDSVIGILSFNEGSPTNVVVPVSLYANVKNTIASQVDALPATGKTPTTTALQFSKTIVESAQQQFSDRAFTFIFVSDGNPNPTSQDPRLATPNPADEIKALGATVYTISIGTESGLENLMRDIASDPSNAYSAPTSTELNSIYEQIGQKICGSSS